MATDKAELEAKAVDKAKATADAAFRPPPSILNASDATILIANVDGPSLEDYEGKESVYVGSSVPVGAGAKLEIPISVITPGSVVDYSIELKSHDIGFGIIASREDGETIVREHSKLSTSECPAKQKFLVGSVPCTITFTLDNEYSWMREKVVTYKITVSPPSKESLIQGRRRRADACLKAVEDDLQQANTRLAATSKQKLALQQEVARMMLELQDKKKAWQVSEDEEKWLMDRQKLRAEQQKLLKQRLKEGWSDEKKKSLFSL